MEHYHKIIEKRISSSIAEIGICHRSERLAVVYRNKDSDNDDIPPNIYVYSLSLAVTLPNSERIQQIVDEATGNLGTLLIPFMQQIGRIEPPTKTQSWEDALGTAFAEAVLGSANANNEAKVSPERFAQAFEALKTNSDEAPLYF